MVIDEPVESSPYWLENARPILEEGDGASLQVQFRQQRRILPARNRITHRTALLVVVLNAFSRKTAKVANLHIFLWALRSARTRRIFVNWWTKPNSIDLVTQRIDPLLDSSIRLSLADGLVTLAGSRRDRLKLTVSGQELAKAVEGADSLLRIEKQFLLGLGAISDSGIDRRMDRLS
ncbi:hypothetical protein ACX3O0_08940 [Homoserinimonas sp. A447]